MADINTENTDHILSIKYKLIKIIKNIHLNKKGADKYSILVAAKNFTKEQIESTLEKLCEDNILRKLTDSPRTETRRPQNMT